MSTNPVFTIHTQYLLLAGCLFLTEILIGSMIHDQYIRPFGGDFLVVIFLYCLFRGICNLKMPTAAFSVLAFAYVIETLQHFHFIRILGLENARLARLVLGTQFSWTDIISYTAGTVFLIAIETKLNPYSNQWNIL